ncbi:uncharacterized protein H6S33_007168 [Morchella sextelata]|uniref:uncharacterized protein n=1 Tax=Morchella sextelata TaxID=1174677 RepID=UPI001D03A1CE|nr:uncharacterized protein H6S33_007168 [Morchella sextelata]KAH0604137.1 hypothetical protein H6S33_007168 [Morchella sextelata]
MKRRGNLAHLPTPKRGLLLRLGGRPARAFTPPQATSPGDVPLDEIDVYEDQSQDAAAMACEEDIGPPESSLPGRLPFQQLSTNIMGVNYRDDLNGEEDFNAGDTENAEDIGADIVFEKETVVEEEPGDELVRGGVEVATAPIEMVAIETETSPIDTTATPNTEPILEEEDPKRRAVTETVADGPAENSKNSAVNDFHIAMMLFVTSSDISRSQYTALTEVLAFATVEGLQTLPRSIKTLRENTRRSLPLSQIKACPVGLNLDVTTPKTEDHRLAYYFDTTEYCKPWLSDPKIRHNLHIDMGVIVENPTELWHGDAWMESVRSTSGVFDKIGEQGSSSRDGSAGAGASENILLPSDCIKYRDSTGDIVYARVKAIGIDGRKTPQGTYSTQRSYLAVVNRLLPVSHIPAEFNRGPLVNDAYPSYPSGLPELVLFESTDIIPCSSILSKEWGYFTDYESPESLRNSLLPYPPTFCVRKIVYSHWGRPFTRPVHKRHRLAAENELIHLTREYVLNTLVAKEGAVRRHMSVQFSTFLDGFGLYRNAYPSLKGMYITPAGLDYNSRSQMANMFVLMLGPFGSNEL